MDLLHTYVLSYASANCMLAYATAPRHLHGCTFSAFIVIAQYTRDQSREYTLGQVLEYQAHNNY